MRVVFWQNILSFYQVPHLTALAAQPDTEVVWVVQQAITPDRVAQGWKVPDVHGVEVVVAPDDAAVQRLVSERPSESVHIFSGIHQEPTARKAFYLCVKTSARIGLLNEPPFPGRLRDLISPTFHRLHRLLYGRRISFILAIGHMGVEFYRAVGYSKHAVFFYGYFPPAPADVPAAPQQSGPVQILYLGQLIERKGVDILLNALGTLKELDWAVTLLGSGDQKDALAGLAKALGIEDRVTFQASLENKLAMRKVESSDLFVLPSRHDGWGVVVNEAVLRGVPAVCSDHCGASDLVQDDWRGETFIADSVPSLAAVLRRRIVAGKRTPETAERIRAWSRCIEGPAVAAYLRDVIAFTKNRKTKHSKMLAMRPLPPWEPAQKTAPKTDPERPLKLCIVADGRSVATKNWSRWFIERGHDVHLISTFPCDPKNPPVASLHVAPLDFSARARAAPLGGSAGGLTTHGNPFFARLRGSLLWKSLAKLRDQLNPFAVSIQQRKVRQIIRHLQPDLVHAMRIPFEGILAARALEGEPFPLLVSVWGNDFTLFAAESPEIARLTRQAMRRADALHPDCERDLHLARHYGLDAKKPFAVLPGNGGVRTDVFHPAGVDPDLRRRWNIPPDAAVVLNPRGVKPYIRIDTFFQAIPLVLAENPNVFFLGAMMEGNSVAEAWVSRLGIENSVRCLPFVTHDEMAQLFRLATITVSPADHDGTPNTLLEAMSCGTFPVAGNIESVREWITNGENGLLFDQSDPASLAQAILEALRNDALRSRAVPLNQRLIAERADYGVSMRKADEFYRQLIADSRSAESRKESHERTASH